MKKRYLIPIICILLVSAGFGYVEFRKLNVEASVTHYLTTEKNIAKSDIVSSEPFIANLRGDKNWMVAIKLKDDAKTYQYYKSNGKVILESYVENDQVHIMLYDE